MRVALSGMSKIPPEIGEPRLEIGERLQELLCHRIAFVVPVLDVREGPPSGRPLRPESIYPVPLGPSTGAKGRNPCLLRDFSEELLALRQNLVQRLFPEIGALRDLAAHLLHPLDPRLVDLVLEVLPNRPGFHGLLVAR